VASPRPFTVLAALALRPESEQALVSAQRLARASQARLILVNVFNPWMDMGHVVASARHERLTYARAARDRYLRQVAARLEGLDVRTWVESQRRGEERAACIAPGAAEARADLLLVVSRSVTNPWERCWAPRRRGSCG
jgi:hypothetical protein